MATTCAYLGISALIAKRPDVLKLIFVLPLLLVTPSTAMAEAPWRFIITGDSRSTGAGESNGVNIEILSEIASEIVSHEADFVLFPGDLVYGGVNQSTLEQQLLTWRGTMQPVYDADINVYPVRGNHDLGSPAGRTAWDNVFSGAYALPTNGPAGEVGLTYSVTHKNVFVLGLDQYVTPHRVNQAWVDDQLEANTQPHVFAFGHEPAFKVGHSDCLDDYPTDRNTFWSSLKDAGCKVYACGHDHFYDHAVVDDNDGNLANDIHQYVVGTAGAPLRTWDPPYDGDNSGMTPEQWNHSENFGYILAEVEDSHITLTWFQRLAAGVYVPVIGPRDLDDDGVTDLNDLELLTSYWLANDCRIANQFCQGADVLQSTFVDMVDFGYFAQLWHGKTIKFSVTAGSDDAEERTTDGDMYLDSTDLELVDDPSSHGDQLVGVRFTNVNIETGAKILNAYVQFTVDEAANVNPCSLTVYAQDTDDAAGFTSADYNISNRAKTSGIAWGPPEWLGVGKAKPEHRTPNIASIIQQVINRPFWTSGNALVIIITGTGRRTAESYDGSPTLAPELYVEIE